jgi:hypothetical protein
MPLRSAARHIRPQSEQDRWRRKTVGAPTPRRSCWKRRPTAEDAAIGARSVSVSSPARRHHRPRIDPRTRATCACRKSRNPSEPRVAPRSVSTGSIQSLMLVEMLNAAEAGVVSSQVVGRVEGHRVEPMLARYAHRAQGHRRRTLASCSQAARRSWYFYGSTITVLRESAAAHRVPTLDENLGYHD